MRRIALYLGIAAAMVASCSIQEENFATPEQEDVIFYASFEQPSEGTRVYANEDLFLRWTADDRVSIFNKNTVNQQFKFLGETGDNAGSFNQVDVTESETGNPISHVVSVYPYQEGTKISEGEYVSLTLPAEQHYAEKTFGLGANTMVSVSSDNVLQYKNVGGYLRISLYGEGISISSITLKGNNGEKLAGKATITMPLDGTPAAVLADDATDEITVVCDTPVALGATAEESMDFWFAVPPVTFSKGFTVFVAKSTGGTFEKSTSKSITIERSNVSKMSPMEVEGGTPDTPIPGAVDLGLPSGLKWASCNLGASKPEEYGDYYAWGETVPYYESQDPLIWKDGKEKGYDSTSYTWCEGMYEMTKYSADRFYGYDGFTDGKTVLDPEDDAAHVNLGGKWRMPTDAEWTELIDNCTWTWTEQNGVLGMLFTAGNGNSIFLPGGGFWYIITLNFFGYDGEYWSSSLKTDKSIKALTMSVGSEGPSVAFADRVLGLSVRPVYGDPPIIPVMSVALDKTELELIIGRGYPLEATVLPEDATNKSVSWSSDNESVATVSSSGVVIGLSAGTAIISVTTADGGKTATCAVTVKAMDIPEAVDLTLPSGVKWASFNIGASKPEEYGDYYAWGEIEPYYYSLDPLIWKEGKESGYTFSSYKWSMDSYTTMTKYCPKPAYGYNGFTDDKTVLDPEDDVAHVKLGDKWRMPTDEEWTELYNQCSWEWIMVNGISGYKGTGPNGKSIFLPAALDFMGTDISGGSFGNYWSSSLHTNEPSGAWGVYFGSDHFNRITYSRYSGFTIRPVYGEIRPESGEASH